MKVVLFSPLPPSPTGIADYSQLLLSGLRGRGVHVDARTEENAPEGVAEEATPIYQMGNSPLHGFMYPFVTRYPGVLVLHDLVLHHSRLATYLARPEVEEYKNDLGSRTKRERALAALEEYASEVELSYPKSGRRLAEIAVRMGGGRLLYDYPLFESLARVSRLVLAHSKAACDTVREHVPEVAVERVRMGIEIPPLVSREEARARLGLSRLFGLFAWGETSVLIASSGLVTPEKQVSTALRALGRLVNRGHDVYYCLVGRTVPHYDALEEARSLGVADRVRSTGRVSADEFWLWACAADLCLNLRYPTGGETSATLLRLMAAGRPVLVSDQAQQLDFPEGTVVRVSPAGAADGLYCDLAEVLGAPERTRRIGEQARKFIESEHRPDVMVDDYLGALKAHSPAVLR